MRKTKRPIAFWVIVAFFGLTLSMILMGQTMAVFNYNFAVQLGLQESVEKVSKFGVQINRALGAGDTLVYLPLITASLVGLFLKKRWVLIVTGTVMGISVYWAVSAVFMLLFLQGVAGYYLTPGIDHWTILGMYITLGLWGLLYLVFQGEKLIQ